VELIRDLLIFIAVMFALCIMLVVVVSLLPESNPLKRVLTALSYRLGATVMAGAIAVPVEPIPGLDVLYDIAVPIALIWYWYTFFRDATSRPNSHRKGICLAGELRTPTTHHAVSRVNATRFPC